MTVSPELDRRFRDAAAAEGLLDVAYDLHDTPVGELLVAVTQRGVCEIHYDADPDAEAERLARLFGTRVLRSPAPPTRCGGSSTSTSPASGRSSSSSSTSARRANSAVRCSSSSRVCPTAS